LRSTCSFLARGINISPKESLVDWIGVTFDLGVNTGDRGGISSLEAGEGLNQISSTLDIAGIGVDLDHEDILISNVQPLISLVSIRDSFIITVCHFYQDFRRNC